MFKNSAAKLLPWKIIVFEISLFFHWNKNEIFKIIYSYLNSLFGVSLVASVQVSLHSNIKVKRVGLYKMKNTIYQYSNSK